MIKKITFFCLTNKDLKEIIEGKMDRAFQEIFFAIQHKNIKKFNPSLNFY